MKTVADQYFNLMNGLADSIIDAPDEEFADERYEYPANRCNYLCGQHLEQCGLEKGHRCDCFCVQGDTLMRCIAARALEQAATED